MTDREKAIVMAYTGISMLVGDDLGVFYEYLNELYGRPVFTHELITLDIKERSKKDFLNLCRGHEKSIEEHKTGKWLLDERRSKEHVENIYICSSCYNNEAWGETERTRYCSYCGAEMENWT